jgi:hypothetical protein
MKISAASTTASRTIVLFCRARKRLGAFLDRVGYLLHRRRPGVALQHEAREIAREQQRGEANDDYE